MSIINTLRFQPLIAYHNVVNDLLARSRHRRVIYVSVGTRWWTHNVVHIKTLAERRLVTATQDGSTVPCDPRGSVLKELHDSAALIFLNNAFLEAKKFKHGVWTFMAAHNVNARDISGSNWCEATWDAYDEAIEVYIAQHGNAFMRRGV